LARAADVLTPREQEIARLVAKALLPRIGRQRSLWNARLVERLRVLLLPGAVLPASLAYGPLITALGRDVEAVAKDLELYAGDAPPADFGMDTEVQGVVREVESRDWGRFHLVGYSGGGAVALAFAARFPDRLSSLALLEPAWAGNWDWSPEHASVWAELDRLETLPPAEFMGAFVRLAVQADAKVPPPRPGEQPAWMAKRPAGIKAFNRAFKTYDLRRDSLRNFHQPVYLALGGLSNPDQYGEIVARLATVFPDCQLEVFSDRHHFDPPHRVEPQRLARSLRAIWQRAK